MSINTRRMNCDIKNSVVSMNALNIVDVENSGC